MIKRAIRLKEMSPNSKIFAHPSKQYYEEKPLLKKEAAYFHQSDDNGYRITGTFHKSKNKIFLLGGSTIENSYVKADKRINYLLEKKILENKFDYEVLNAAVSGATLLNLLNTITNKIGNSKNSIILLTIPSNDYRVLEMKNSYWNGHKYYTNIIPGTGFYPKNESFENNLNDLKGFLHVIQAYCRAFNIQLMISGIIHNNQNINYEIINSIVKDWCKQNNISFLASSELLAKNKNIFYDDVHFNENGSEIASEIIFNSIKPHLKKSLIKFSEMKISNDIHLTDKVIWSNYLDVNEDTKLSLWLDLYVEKKILHNSILYIVDYDSEVNPQDCKLNKSSIGLYSYIPLQQEKFNSTQFFNILIPKGVKKIRVGIKKWNRQAEIFLTNSFLNKIN